MIAAANKKFASFTLDFRRRPRSPARGFTEKAPSSSICQIPKSPSTGKWKLAGGNWSPLGRRQCDGESKCHHRPSTAALGEGGRGSGGGEKELEEDGSGKNANGRRAMEGTKSGGDGRWHRQNPPVPRKRTTTTTMTIGRRRLAEKKGGLGHNGELPFRSPSP
uniref:Uncharacterized protein n=1 Tax=Globodera rostochiensis TaxID=31243 RepID=A0A914H010_GLORO